MEKQQVRVLRIVVASPGDVQAERKALPDVIDEINRGVAADRNLRLELSRWETDTYPGFHADGPQGEIDTILRIDDCDLLIGIFWHRFGTPTMDAASGTEHEFRLAHQAWRRSGRPQIMVYFNDRAYSPRSREETDQWSRVFEFKSNFPKEGLWWPYRGSAQLVSLVRNHLTQYVRNLRLGTVTLEAATTRASAELSTLESTTKVPEGTYVDPETRLMWSKEDKGIEFDTSDRSNTRIGSTQSHGNDLVHSKVAVAERAGIAGHVDRIVGRSGDNASILDGVTEVAKDATISGSVGEIIGVDSKKRK